MKKLFIAVMVMIMLLSSFALAENYAIATDTASKKQQKRVTVNIL